MQSGDGTAGRDAEKQLRLRVAQRHQPGQAQVDRGPHDLLQGGPEACSAGPTHLQPTCPQLVARRAARGGGAGQTSSREQRKAPGPAACRRAVGGGRWQARVVGWRGRTGAPPSERRLRDWPACAPAAPTPGSQRGGGEPAGGGRWAARGIPCGGGVGWGRLMRRGCSGLVVSDRVGHDAS